MTLKRLVVSFACIGISICTIAQVKDSVVSVRPIAGVQARARFLEIARYLRGTRASAEAGLFEMIANSQACFSGVLVDTGNGNHLILTNRCGVVFSDTAEVTFTLRTGDLYILENCPVVYRATDVGIACIRLSGEVPAGVSSLSLCDTSIETAEEIWAAGYTLIGGKLTYQFTSGIVTDSSAWNDSVLPSAVDLIRHSAPVAPGCAGGPLLVSTPSGYKIVGINNWWQMKPWYACYADPGSLIREALVRMNTEYQPDSQPEDVLPQAMAFAESLTQEEFSRLLGDRYISTSLAEDKGWFLFKGVLGSTSKPAFTKLWSERFYRYSPGDTLKHFVSYRLYDKLHSSIAPRVVSAEKSPDSRNGRFLVRTVFISEKGKKFWVDWGWECGNWLAFSTNALGPSLVSK